MKKSLFYLFACASVMLFTISCNKDEVDFDGSITNPITSVEVKDGNVVSKIDNGQMVEIIYYNYVGGKLDNMKVEIHHKSKDVANITYDALKSLGELDSEFSSIAKDGKVIKLEYKKDSGEFETLANFSAEELAAHLRLMIENGYTF